MSDLTDAYMAAYKLTHTNKLVKSKKHFIRRLDDAYREGNIEEVDTIYDELLSPEKKLPLRWFKNKILETVGCHYGEIEDILDAIHNYIEADLVLECVEGSEWITDLPDEKISRYNYSKQVKFQRRKLEKLLKKDSKTGVNRAKKISQIVLSI